MRHMYGVIGVRRLARANLRGRGRGRWRGGGRDADSCPTSELCREQTRLHNVLRPLHATVAVVTIIFLNKPNLYIFGNTQETYQLLCSFKLSGPAALEREAMQKRAHALVTDERSDHEFRVGDEEQLAHTLPLLG